MSLLIVLGVLGLPALALRLLCVGNACGEEAEASSEVPFCSLEPELRSHIEAGFREGRSPEVLAIARDQIAGGTSYRDADIKPPWPSPDLAPTRVPIVFHGDGVATTELADGVTVDRIAPTLAQLIGFERPFPEVRSGEPLDGAFDGSVGGEGPRLLLQVILKGIGSDDLDGAPSEWPYLAALMDEGAATTDGDTGSVPLDPAAIIATIGTGGMPRQHGITGTFVRNDEGDLVRAFSKRADTPVIATLSDDLDEELDQEPLIGLVGTAPVDRGATGGDWYVGGDRDRIAITERGQAGAAVEMLRRGFGADAVPDLLTVVMEGDVEDLDRGLKRVVSAAEEASDGSVVTAVTATGSVAPRAGGDGAEIVSEVEDAVGEPVVEAAVPGGLFLDQRALADLEVSEDLVRDELTGLRGSEGELFGDVFPAIAVSFARYC